MELEDIVGIEVLRLAKFNWERREQAFPAFTRMSWENGTRLAKDIAIAQAQAEIDTIKRHKALNEDLIEDFRQLDAILAERAPR